MSNDKVLLEVTLTVEVDKGALDSFTTGDIVRFPKSITAMSCDGAVVAQGEIVPLGDDAGFRIAQLFDS